MRCYSGGQEKLTVGFSDKAGIPHPHITYIKNFVSIKAPALT
jgi:hypothetical protein